ncbi:MAG: hypothetical protein U0640_12485 [Phycisphaerales bacterium]
MSAIDPKRWATLLRKLSLPAVEPAEFLAPPPAPPGSDPLTHHAVFGLLLWESSTQQAAAALKRILSVVVDYNELRVSRVDDIASWLGDKFPLASNRALRIRAMLSDIYARQQTVQLSPMLLGSKKDTTHALQALDGITPFAVARVMALGLGRKAIPLDLRTLALLHKSKVIGAADTIETASTQIAALTPEESLIDTLARLQHWSDTDGTPGEHADISPAPHGDHSPQERTKSTPAKQQAHDTDPDAAPAQPRKPASRPRTTRRLRP